MTTEFLKNREEIEAWLQKHSLYTYTLHEDPTYGYKVDIASDVYINQRHLKTVPVKFNHVSGSVDCSGNELTSLEFAPETVLGDFECSNNKLTSLAGAPKTVGGNFECHKNQLKTLVFCPENVGLNFYCNANELVSLEFLPQSVGGTFNCRGNPKLGDFQRDKTLQEVKVKKEKALLHSFIPAGNLPSQREPKKKFKV